MLKIRKGNYYKYVLYSLSWYMAKLLFVMPLALTKRYFNSVELVCTVADINCMIKAIVQLYD